jgi:hypothetical protein
MAFTLKDQDNGYKALVKTVFGFAKPVVTIGIHEKEGSHPYPNGKTLLDIANINEFGSDDGHVPMRSFVRAWFDTAEPELRKEIASLMEGVIDGTLTKDQILDAIGLSGVGKMQANIAQGVPPPNAPRTIQLKGSSTPLVDTGLLRSSITYEVDPGDGSKP